MAKEKAKGPLAKLVWLLVLLLGLALLLYGLFGFWQQYEATNNAPPADADKIVTHSTDKPDETTVDSCDRFKVAAQEPQKINIPSIGVDGCIQKVGIDQNNSIAVPTNVHVSGWFVESPLPGDKGVSIIDGHVLGRYKPAIFSNLSNVKAGDEIRIQLGDKSLKKFGVVSVNEYSAEQTVEEQYKALNGIDRQLTLITCSGTFDNDSQSYDNRIVVRAKLL